MSKPTTLLFLREVLSPKPQLVLPNLAGNINIYHPDYPREIGQLFSFPPVDGGGYHHETARVSCAILANSAWDGFLSHSPQGSPVDIPPDGVLTPGHYFFCIPNAPRKHICPHSNCGFPPESNLCLLQQRQAVPHCAELPTLFLAPTARYSRTP